MTTAAIGCLVPALLVPAAWWSAFFAGPRPADAAGVTAWRIMLVALSATLVTVAFLLRRLAPGPAPGAPIPARNPTTGWIIAGLVLIGLLARATRIGECLWYDEIVAWRDYGMLGVGPIVGTYFDPANHVAHTLLSWCSVQALEPMLGGAMALRLPALLASLGAIPVMYALGAEALGRRGGLVAAGAAAVLPVAVLEGVDARAYAIMILGAAAANVVLLAAWRRNSAGAWCGYAVICAAAAWAHPISAFVPAGHAAYFAVLLARSPHRRRAAAGLVAIAFAAVLTATLYAPILPAMLRLRDIVAADTGTAPRLLGREGLHTLWQLGGSWTWWAALPGLLLVGLGAVTCRDRPDLRRIVILGWAGPALFLAAILATGTWYYARFALFAMPGAIVLLAAGVDTLRRRSPWLGVAAMTLVVAAAAGDLVTRPPRQPLRDAADHVARVAGPDAEVIVLGLRHRVLDLYAGDLRLVYSNPHGADFDRVLATTRAKWLVLYYPRHVSKQTRATMHAAGFTKERRYPGWMDWGNGDVEVWRRP